MNWSCPIDRPLSWWRILRIQNWRNKLVSCFSNLTLLHNTYLCNWHAVGSAARMEYVFLPLQRHLFQREPVWIDCGTMTVSLFYTSVDNRSVMFLTILHSGFVGRLTESAHLMFFVPIFSIFQECHNVLPSYCSVDNLYVVGSSWSAWKLLTNSHSLLCCASAGINFQTRWLKPIDAGWNLTGTFPPVVCARGRPQLEDCGESTTPELRWSISVGINCRA